MGGLGNGRRGGRSPPLMIGALIACILLLGFNYWMSNSRNLELQTKLYELEGQVRRGTAERGVAEMKKNEFLEVIQRQKEEISHIESLYKKQLEAAQNTCSQERDTLQQSISSCTKTTEELKGQLNQLNEDLGKLQKELQHCHDNINTLNKKLTYEMTHCDSQIQSQKELCDERLAAAEHVVQKKMEKLDIPPPGVSSQESQVTGALKVEETAMTGADKIETPAVVNHTLVPSQPKGKEPSELNTVPDVPVDPPVKDAPHTESHSVPSAPAIKKDSLLPPEGDVKTQEKTNQLVKNNFTEDKEVEVMDVHDEGAHTEGADPGMKGMLIGQGKVDESPDAQKLEEPEEYDADEQIVGNVGPEKQQQSKQAENIDKEMEEELADYNGDDENEGEFEADKQAALSQN